MVEVKIANVSVCIEKKSDTQLLKERLETLEVEVEKIKKKQEAIQ